MNIGGEYVSLTLSLVLHHHFFFLSTIHQNDARGAHRKECEANRQPRSCGIAIQPSGLDGSEEPAGGGRR